MKIYVSHARRSNFEKELYEPIKNFDLAKRHQFIFAHDDKQEIDTEDLFRQKGCDLILAEVSTPATGQGIELGYAKVLEIPIICIFKKGSDISQSLKYVTDKFIEYTDAKDLIQKLEKELNEETKN